MCSILASGMSRKTVLLLFGGESSEHDVSAMSARNVYAAMDNEKYHVLICYIDKHGKWWLLDSWSDDLSQHGGKQLVAALGLGSFVTYPGNEVVHVDVIFPVLHGQNGEDGTVQGLAKLLHIPIVGCGVTASAVCMDKVLTKQILEANDIKSAPYKVFQKGGAVPSYQEVAGELGEVLFVKPARSGSSVGVSKVSNEAEFLSAIELALEHDEKVLIEKSLTGRELETAVLGNPPHHKVSGVGEIIPGADFYDHNDKYSPDSQSKVVVDADIPKRLELKIQKTSLKAYQLIGCTGLSRVDYILVDQTPYIIEINTMPGFTSISMYPKLWQKAGMRYPELIDKLIELAL